jgi:hypothetical protein
MPGKTRWTVEARRYFLDEWEEGVAERVRAERHDGVAWVRVLEAVYWWPTHEGKEWPGKVITPPELDEVKAEPDVWAHVESELGHDERYRWELLPNPAAPE